MAAEGGPAAGGGELGAEVLEAGGSEPAARSFFAPHAEPARTTMIETSRVEVAEIDLEWVCIA
jgi:hypothetical protein